MRRKFTPSFCRKTSSSANTSKRNSTMRGSPRSRLIGPPTGPRSPSGRPGPGIIIGQKGAEIEKLQKEIQKMTQREISINIQEVRRVETDAQLVAENVALQLERRVAFRRAMKKSVTACLKFGAQGIKISCAGRLGGAEIARSEWYREGRVPLHTLRADIDYGFAEARTTYGAIGIKVWIYKGEILPAVRGRKETTQ